MRKRKFSLNQKHKIAILTLALVITGGGIIHNNEAEAMDSKQVNQQQVSQKELDMVFGKQIKTIDIFPEKNKINSNILVKPEYNISLDEKYQNLIWKLCEKNNLSYELVLAVFYNESKFDPIAKNRNKDGSIDRGISMTNSRYINTYKEFAIKYCDFQREKQLDVFNPDDSIRAGIGGLVHFRNYLIDMGIDDSQLTPILLGTYNRGYEGMKDYINKYKTTQTNYSKKILHYKNELEQNHTLT